MPWRLVTIATAAVSGLVALFGGLWWLLCKRTDDAVLDGFLHLTNDEHACLEAR